MSSILGIAHVGRTRALHYASLLVLTGAIVVAPSANVEYFTCIVYFLSFAFFMFMDTHGTLPAHRWIYHTDSILRLSVAFALWWYLPLGKEPFFDIYALMFAVLYLCVISDLTDFSLKPTRLTNLLRHYAPFVAAGVLGMNLVLQYVFEKQYDAIAVKALWLVSIAMMMGWRYLCWFGVYNVMVSAQHAHVWSWLARTCDTHDFWQQCYAYTSRHRNLPLALSWMSLPVLLRFFECQGRLSEKMSENMSADVMKAIVDKEPRAQTAFDFAEAKLMSLQEAAAWIANLDTQQKPLDVVELPAL